MLRCRLWTAGTLPARMAVWGLLMVLLAGMLSLGACGKKEEAAPGTQVIESGTAKAPDGVEIYYTVQGEGEAALVFIHGWCCDGSYWSEQLNHFGQTHRVVAIDLGGHGQSGTERQEWTVEAFAADVQAVVEKLGLPKVVLVGHSMGGTIALVAAAEMPDRVVGIIGVDTLRDLGRERDEETIEGYLAPLRADFPTAMASFVRQMFNTASDTTLVNWVTADMTSQSPEIAVSVGEHLFGYDLISAAKAAKVPVHCINSDYFPTNLEGNRELVPGFQVTLMSDVGHFPQLEKPEEFNQNLAAAVQGFH